MSDINPHEAVDFIYKNSAKYAKAKSERVYLEQFRKSKKAMLIQESTDNGVQAKESYAYSHPDYIELLAGLRAAVEVEETLRWHITSAQARIEIFRTESANDRANDRNIA